MFYTKKELIDKSTVLLVVLSSLALLWWYALSGGVPLTYDEAWNYLFLSERGPRYVVTNYPFPNNHVFFTLVQSFLPSSWIHRDPLLLRLPNSLFALVFLALVSLAVRRLQAAQWLQIAAPFFLLFGSPIATTYFFVARGYLLGASLTVAAAAMFSSERFILGALALTLAGYCTPTFLFVVPGFFAFYLVLALQSKEKRHWRGLILIAVQIVILTSLFYGPIASQVAANSKSFKIYASSYEFVVAVVQSMTNFGEYGKCYWFGCLLFIISLPLFLSGVRQIKAADLPTRFIVVCTLAVFSAIAVSAMLNAFGLANLPFLRSFSFVPILVLASAVSGLIAYFNRCHSRYVMILPSCFLIFNSLYGFYRFSVHFGDGDPQGFPHFSELSGTPIERAVKSDFSFKGKKLFHSWRIEPNVKLYSFSLGFLPVVVDTAAMPKEPCMEGVVAPMSGNEIVLEGEGALCF